MSAVDGSAHRRSGRQKNAIIRYMPEPEPVPVGKRSKRIIKAVAHEDAALAADKEAEALKIILDYIPHPSDKHKPSVLFARRNLGFKDKYDGTTLTFDQIEKYHQEVEEARIKQEISGMGDSSILPSEEQAKDFSKMLWKELHPSQPYKFFIQRKYFMDTIKFDTSDIPNHMIKLRLINEAIGNRRDNINRILSGGAYFSQLETKLSGDGRRPTQDAQNEIDREVKQAYLALCVLASFERLTIINRKDGFVSYVPLRLASVHKEEANKKKIDYIKDFAAVSLYYLGMNLESVKTQTPLSIMFEVFKEHSKSDEFYGKTMMDEMLPVVLEKIAVEMKEKWAGPIFSLYFDDTNDFGTALKTVGQITGHSAMVLRNERVVQQEDLGQEHLDDETNREADRVALRNWAPNVLPALSGKTRKAEEGYVQQLGFRGEIYNSGMQDFDRAGNRVAAHTQDMNKKARSMMPAMPATSVQGGGKDLEKLLKKKHKESRKNFKLIDNLEKKLKKIVEKILELEKKKKELQKKCKKTKSKKDKKLLDNILKRIKKEKDNKKKLKKDISKNKKHSKIILKELKQIDKIKKKGGICACKKQIK